MEYNLFDCRSMVRNPTGEETLSSKQPEKDRLSVLSFQNKEQQTDKLNQTYQCTLCTIMEETINKLRNYMTALQKKQEEFDKVITERDMLVIRLQNYAHLDEELEKLREKVSKGNVMKTENVKLNVDVAGQLHSEAKRIQETINRLNETVVRISSENKELQVKMAELAEQHHSEVKKNQETINRLNRLDETADRISFENKELHGKMAEPAEQHYSEVKNSPEIINRLNETLDRISFKIEKLRVEIAEQHHREAKKYQETINRGNETADSISPENKKLEQEIDWLHNYVEDDGIIVARSDEAVEHLNAEGCRKITNKEVSQSYPSCRFSGEVNTTSREDDFLLGCCVV
jgi:uncharacterized coiled-coil DUF342 family protein